MELEKNVILYTTHCPMCRQLERQLGMKGIKYEEVEDVEKFRELGFTQMPMLEADGKTMNFQEAIKWIRSC